MALGIDPFAVRSGFVGGAWNRIGRFGAGTRMHLRLSNGVFCGNHYVVRQMRGKAGVAAMEIEEDGGETGIRTLVRVSPKHAFQACAFNHSAISPIRKNRAARACSSGVAIFFRIPCRGPPASVWDVAVQ